MRCSNLLRRNKKQCFQQRLTAGNARLNPPWKLFEVGSWLAVGPFAKKLERLTITDLPPPTLDITGFLVCSLLLWLLFKLSLDVKLPIKLVTFDLDLAAGTELFDIVL